MPTDLCDLRIEHFDPARHNRAGFSCGVDWLDNFLKLNAKRQQKDDMTRVYVIVEEGNAKILGYHAINLGMMDAGELAKRPRGAPDHGELPILFLGQVAVSENAQGQGLGLILMHHVFAKADAISQKAGCFAIVIDFMADGEKAGEIKCPYRHKIQPRAKFSSDLRRIRTLRSIAKFLNL